VGPDRRLELLAAIAGAAGGPPIGSIGLPFDLRARYAVPDASVRSDWDVVTTAEAAVTLGCDALEFVALADGRLLVDEDVPEGSLIPFAQAVEAALEPPYKAAVVLVEGRLWGIGATRATLIHLGDVDGDRCEISRVGGNVELTVDGTEAPPTPDAVAALEPFTGDVALAAEWLEDSAWIATIWQL
jgi:hypothetical protein